MTDERTMATTAGAKPHSRERRSEIAPITVGDRASPSKWMVKMLTAIVVARMCAPTELTTAAFNGPVFNNSKNSATKIPGNISDDLEYRARIMAGIANAMLAAETR